MTKVTESIQRNRLFSGTSPKSPKAEIQVNAMKRAKKFKKKTMLEAAHEMAKGLYDANVFDAKTMREFDTLCLPPVKDFSPREIKKLRLHEKVSQAIFAKCLNTSTSNDYCLVSVETRVGSQH